LASKLPDLTVTEVSLGEPGQVAVFNQNIDARLLATLSYVPLSPLNLAVAVIILLSPADNTYYVRFHALQSIIFAAGCFAVSTCLGIASSFLAFIPLLGGLAAMILSMVVMLLWFVYMIISVKMAYDTHTRKAPHLPYVSQLAADIARKFPN
jgi:uncharacterized membrane protein